MNEFFNMSGYGLYVWGSYAFSTIVILWLVISTLLNKKRLEKENNKDA